jgi:hypothetical protein
MSSDDAGRQLEQLARDLDLAVFALERSPTSEEALRTERIRLRRELESLRDRLEDLARGLSG